MIGPPGLYDSVNFVAGSVMIGPPGLMERVGAAIAPRTNKEIAANSKRIVTWIWVWVFQ